MKNTFVEVGENTQQQNKLRGALGCTLGPHERKRCCVGNTTALLLAATALLGFAAATPAHAQTTPEFVDPFNKFGIGDVFVISNPELADIDGDGDLDAFVGSSPGDTFHFENIGSASAPVFDVSSSNPFGLTNEGFSSAPDFADIDGDGDLDAFVGSSAGDTFYFENIGSASAPDFAAPSTNPFSLTNEGERSNPDFADIDGDGDLDAFVGSIGGDTFYFENVGNAILPTFDSAIPNPFGLVSLANQGGWAAPDLSDVDGDGDLDVVAGAQNGQTVYFENIGSASAPAFAAGRINPFGLIDVGARSTPTLADMNGDGDLDMFVGNDLGHSLHFENVGSMGVPAFVAPIITNPFGLAGVGLRSTPALADIDGDGDLDAFVGNDNGNTIYFENIGSASAPTFAAGQENHFGLVDVGGESAPTLADIDGDGDLDVFVGAEDGRTIYFENGGSASLPAFLVPIARPFGITDVGDASTPVFADIDADGDLDAFVGEMGGDMVFFRNIGSTSSPSFDAPASNPFGLVNEASRSKPALADIDGDGDFDALIGSGGGGTVFFENTGSASNPAFAAPIHNPSGLVDVGGANAPALADLDGDGDLDAVAGEFTGRIYYFENIAPIANPFGLADVGSRSAPTLADIDGDGDLDAFVGDASGNIFFFKHIGTASVPAFAVAKSKVFGLDAVSSLSTPEFADIDGDGDLDAFIGENTGETILFTNTGSASSPAFTGPLISPFGLTDVGAFSAPALADIDADGDLDAFVGTSTGDTFFFRNKGSAKAPEFVAALSNPFGLGNVGARSAPEFADIDRDGDLDAFFGESKGFIIYFENIGSASDPDFGAPQTNPFGIRDVGIQSKPALADIDGDGDFDFLIGDGSGNTTFFENRINDNFDLDDDGIPNDYEIANGLDPHDSDDADSDLDMDGRSNREEFLAGTAANNPDSDGDFLGDGIDAEPNAASNMCIQDGLGDAEFSTTARSNMVSQCAAESSVTIRAIAIFEPQSSLQIISPRIIFDPKVGIPVTGELQIQAADPTPGMAP